MPRKPARTRSSITGERLGAVDAANPIAMGSPTKDNDANLDRFVIPNDVHAVRKPEAVILEKLHRYHYSNDSIFAIRLAFQEAIVNAVRHGNGSDPNKRITVEISVDADRAIIQIEDEGMGYRPADVPDPTSPDRIRLPSGRGIMLIRAYMSRVDFNERGNRIRMVKENE